MMNLNCFQTHCNNACLCYFTQQDATNRNHLQGTDIYISVTDLILSICILRTHFPITKLTAPYLLFALHTNHYQEVSPQNCCINLFAVSNSQALHVQHFEKVNVYNKLWSDRKFRVTGSEKASLYFHFYHYFLYLLSDFIEIPRKTS